MSRHSKRSVRILNPTEGGAQFTTRRSARRYVEQGRARWTAAGSLEFWAADPRHQAASSASAPLRPHSPSIAVLQRAICAYRNEVLGLPNFVGFVLDKSTPSRRVAA